MKVRISVLLMAAACVSGFCAAPQEEFKVKREAVFEFVQKPVVVQDGDNVTITFESKGFCDATVAIENADGKIVRHLASGVLGDRAPAPFQKNTRKQTLVWDGKDERGAYVDDKISCSVRVSLGLKPQFERTLFWHPMKPNWHQSPILCAAPEGVYVYQGGACDQLRLFDHEGNYVRAVYPFPAAKVNQVEGLKTQVFPQDGRTLPLKSGFLETTLLTCGPNSGGYTELGAANALAVHDKTIALLHGQSNLMATDGSSQRGLQGPQTGVLTKVGVGQSGWEETLVPPRSAAFSPDGRWLYTTGYGWYNGWMGRGHGWLHAVMRVRADGRSEPEVFAGSKEKAAAEADRLNVPTSVDIDSQGRIYVSDYFNNRIQVFSEDRKLLKSIPAMRPAQVAVHRRTGAIYVFSWHIQCQSGKTGIKSATLTHLVSFENPAVAASYPLPVEGKQDEEGGWDRDGGFRHRVALDSWYDPARIWVVHRPTSALLHERDSWPTWETAGVLLLEENGGKLHVKRDFRAEVKKAVVRTKPPILWRQRLYANPINGRLYIAEGDAGVMKSVRQFLEVDPATGEVRTMDLPFDSEDFAFDLSGMVYLRTDKIVARYDLRTWREVPFDYGEEKESVSFGGWGGKVSQVQSGISLPGFRPGCFHEGGMWISPKGHLAVTCYNTDQKESKRVGLDTVDVHAKFSGGSKFTPALYPGRIRGTDIHVWDRYGKMLYEDAVPGLYTSHGIGIDAEDALYVLGGGARVLDGKPYFDPQSCTLFKCQPHGAKILSGARAPIELAPDARPKRPPDYETAVGAAWAENAEWFYGGVGFGGGTGCVCWNCRPAFDYFARSFLPETRRFSVAVLDKNGNLILRIGSYGNVDDGKPLIPDGGAPNPVALGGDEVSLFHAAYLATSSDRRLFIADAGNQRILSVRLNYHAEQMVALKDVPDKIQKGD